MGAEASLSHVHIWRSEQLGEVSSPSTGWVPRIRIWSGEHLYLLSHLGSDFLFLKTGFYYVALAAWTKLPTCHVLGLKAHSSRAYDPLPVPDCWACGLQVCTITSSLVLPRFTQ